MSWKPDLQKWVQKEPKDSACITGTSWRWYHIKLETLHGAPAPGKKDGCEQQEKNSRLFPCFYINFLIYCFQSDSGHFSLPIKYFNEITPLFHQSKRFPRATTTSFTLKQTLSPQTPALQHSLPATPLSNSRRHPWPKVLRFLIHFLNATVGIIMTWRQWWLSTLNSIMWWVATS